MSYNDFLGLFNFELIRTLPRESTKFAKDYFKKEKIKAVEIGTLEGKNALSILKNLNVEKLYIIDPYTEYCDYSKDENYRDIEHKEFLAHKRLKKYWDKITWVKDYSHVGLKEIKEEIDFIYVDGNHEYEYVKLDLELGWEILTRGGVIAGHDIQYSGVSQAVLEFASKNKLEVKFGDRRDWWIIK